MKMLTFGQDEDALLIPMGDGTAELGGSCSVEIDVILAFNELRHEDMRKCGWAVIMTRGQPLRQLLTFLIMGRETPVRECSG